MKKYTEEELVQNYEKFINFIRKVFAKDEDRLNKLLHMYSPEELGEELMFAPASGKAHFHNAYVGGYLDHVMNVCKNAFNLKKMFAEGGGNINFTDEELFFAALHHDLGKLGDGNMPYYIPEESDWHRKNQNSLFKQNPELYWMNVPDRALWLLNQYGITYSQNEMLGIKLADGLYDDSNKKYFVNYSDGGFLKTELPYLLHWADHMSCRIELAEYERSLSK
jgi:hypothetical protein